MLAPRFIGALVASALIIGVCNSTKSQVSRYVTVYDVIKDVSDTPEVSAVIFPARFKVRFKFQHGMHILDLRRNSGIRLETVGCVQTNCSSTRQQLVSFYQDVDNGASIQITCSNNLCETFTLLGTFMRGNVMYLMEPILKSRKYKIKELSGASRLRTDYYETDDMEAVLRRAGRRRRAAGLFEVELLFITDYSVYRYWSNFAGATASAEELINIFYAFIANGVDVRYKGINTEPYQIRIVYLGVVIATRGYESPWSTDNMQPDGTLDADQVLGSFNNWVANKNSLPKHDHAMGFTRLDLVKNPNSGPTVNITGYAFQGAICQQRSVSLVEENLNFISHTVAAHELGHSLGAKHDGYENLCPSASAFIMEAKSSAVFGAKASNPWSFSVCSKNEMAELLSSLDSSGGNCLKRTDHTDTSSWATPDLTNFVTSNRLGQEYSIHRQCVHIMDNPQSYACLINFNNDFSTICTGLWCYNPEVGGSCELVVPFDYTTCGTGKWCMNGRCTEDRDAPREPETCLFGNYPNVNCSYVQDNPSACYFGSQTSCCKSCNDVSFGDPGCEYGDRQESCSAITSGAPCYSGNTDIQCCATCASYRTQIPSCEYGDQRNCSALTFPGDCYASLSDGSAARNVCCQTCKNFEIGIQGCRYGDRVLDCRVSECSAYSSAGVLQQCCDTCRYYNVPTPAPGSNSTALPSWVIPVAGGGGGLLLIIIIVVVCCCCHQSPSGKAAMKYQQEMPRGGLRDPNRQQLSNPRYKSEIRQPNGTEYMGPISTGGYSHTYDLPGDSMQQKQGLQRQMSTNSHVYMELEPDPRVTVQSGYVVSSNTSDQQYTNPGYQQS